MIINLFRIFTLYTEIINICILLKFTSGNKCIFVDCSYLHPRKFEINTNTVNNI